MSRWIAAAFFAWILMTWAAHAGPPPQPSEELIDTDSILHVYTALNARTSVNGGVDIKKLFDADSILHVHTALNARTSVNGGVDIKDPYRIAQEHPNDLPNSISTSDEQNDFDEVIIGYFGPDDPLDPTYGDLWCAAVLAVEEANSQGGFQGKPFRLISAWSESPWKNGVRDLTRLIYYERVWAVLGGVDGPSTHLAEQIAAKAGLAVISPVATDKTVNLAGVPWIFSCSPGDRRLAAPLAEIIAQNDPNAPFVLLEANNHDSHLFAIELLKMLALQETSPQHHFQFSSGETEFSELASRTMETAPGVVAVIADEAASANLVREIRSQGYQGPIFGSPAMAREMFRRITHNAAEGVVFPLTTLAGSDSSTEKWEAFSESFEQRFGRTPEPVAAQAYDAANLIILSIRKSGLDRLKIAQEIRDIEYFDGAAGRITWDPTGANTRQVRLGVIQDGRLCVMPTVEVIEASGP